MESTKNIGHLTTFHRDHNFESTAFRYIIKRVNKIEHNEKRVVETSLRIREVIHRCHCLNLLIESSAI